mgnify:CR=1 FL=1
MAQTQHVLVCVSQFSKQENPETAFKGVASTIDKNSGSYLINRKVYQNRGLNKIFGIMQRILLILPVVIAVAAAIFFALRPQMEAYKALANRLYVRGARHRDVIWLETVWLLLMLGASIVLSQLLGEGIFALCKQLSGMPWQPFSSFGISLIAILTTMVVLAVYTKKSILPLADATYSERYTGKVLVAMEVGKNFAYTFGKRRKYSNRSPAFWAGLATSLVFVLMLCGLAELKQGNYRLNVQKSQRNIEASIYTEEGKYTYRYGDFSIWEGNYFDKEQVEALASLPPVTVYEPEYVPKPPVVDTSEPLDIQRLDDGHTWLIQGPWLQRLMANVNFDDYESRMWFDKALRESGLYQQLEERGIEDGDTVSLDGYEFEYQY